MNTFRFGNGALNAFVRYPANADTTLWTRNRTHYVGQY